MTDCTERCEGRAGMPGPRGVNTQATPVAASPNRINSVKRLSVGQENR